MPMSAFGTDPATMQNRTVADVAVSLDQGIGSGEAVHDAGILDIDARFRGSGGQNRRVTMRPGQRIATRDR